MNTRDIVVIGASAGGLVALQHVLQNLGHDFPGSLFIIMHIGPGNRLTQVLERATALPIAMAQDGEIITAGRILVAPPGHHLLLNGHRVLLSRGPKQNGHRPAIDPLFASAARNYGKRVVGVVLSGMLDDGSAGLLKIKQAGGATIVQSPTEALHPDMPQNAILTVEPEHILESWEIGAKLSEFARRNGGKTGMSRKPKSKVKRAIAKGETDPMIHPNGKLCTLTCPDCGGTLWEVHKGNLMRFGCHIGHNYSAQSLMALQGAKVEVALWTALRALKERARLLTKLASPAGDTHRLRVGNVYKTEAEEVERQAELLRDVLLGQSGKKQPATDTGTSPAAKTNGRRSRGK
jgi:two-component system chemotaxis response regulator CheB